MDYFKEDYDNSLAANGRVGRPLDVERPGAAVPEDFDVLPELKLDNWERRGYDQQGPVNEGRKGGWPITGVHTVTTLVGAGVLGLPLALSYVGWGGGAVLLLLGYVTSLYTLWQLANMHEIKYGNPPEERWCRFSRYHELSDHAFGPKLGLWLLIPPQLIVLIGTGIVYMIVGGRSLKAVWDLYNSNSGTSFGISAWILVFFGAQLILSQMPNFTSLRFISIVSACMSLAYSTIIVGASIAHGRDNNVTFNHVGNIEGADNKPIFRTNADAIFGVFNALGTFAFAYGGHSLALEIQSTLPRPPTARRYMGGVCIAYVVVAWCYPATAFAGYWAFGTGVTENILQSIERPTGLVAAANLMVMTHVLGSYQLYSMPIYDMVETVLRIKSGYKLVVGWPTRLVYRSLYTCFTAFLALSMPFFSEIMGFIGAFAIIPTNFIFPPIIWLRLKHPVRWGMHWLACWLCIIYGVIVAIFGSIGALRNIITKAQGYGFYQ